MALLCGLPVDLCANQKRLTPRPDPAAQLLDYYRKYPDRYIRILEESWKFDLAKQTHGHPTAIHSLALKNIAGATYYAIEVRFSYQTSSGKELLTHTAKIDGGLGPLATRQITVKVGNVPNSAERVVTSIVKAAIY